MQDAVRFWVSDGSVGPALRIYSGYVDCSISASEAVYVYRDGPRHHPDDVRSRAPHATEHFPENQYSRISLVWTYGGLQPQEMEQRITGNVERGISHAVNDVEHIESPIAALASP